MRSIVTVTTPPDYTNLTTLETVKAQLGITGSASDVSLDLLIAQASSRGRRYLSFNVALDVVSETFRPDRGYECVGSVTLDRIPVVEITTLTLDGVELDEDEFEVEPETGALYRLDGEGARIAWHVTRALVAAYSGGYVLPEDSGRNLPEAIEAGAIALVRTLWFARRADPAVRSVDVPDIMTETRWVGAPGEHGALPPDVEAMWAPFRRMRL